MLFTSKTGLGKGATMTRIMRGRGIATTAFVFAFGFGLAGGFVSARATDNRLPAPPFHPDVTAQGANVDLLFKEARYEFLTGNYRVARRMLNGMLIQFPDTRHGGPARVMLRQMLAAKFRNRHRSGLGLPREAEARAPTLPSTPTIKAPAVTGWKVRVSKPYLPQNDLAEAAGDRVFFASKSTKLNEKACRVLRAQARWLATHPGFGLVIAGHADELGSAAYDIVLSMQRAETVRAWLIGQGVAKRRLQIVGYGSTQRVALCRFAACFAQNRRVVSGVRRWSRRTGFRRQSSRRDRRALR